jgi:hypothetical protein
MDIIAQARKKVQERKKVESMPRASEDPETLNREPMTPAPSPAPEPAHLSAELLLLGPKAPDMSALMSTDSAFSDVWTVGVKSKGLISATREIDTVPHDLTSLYSNLGVPYVLGLECYALAEAISRSSGVSSIHIHGVVPDDACLPCFEYLLGFAAGRGIKVVAPGLFPWERYKDRIQGPAEIINTGNLF